MTTRNASPEATEATVTAVLDMAALYAAEPDRWAANIRRAIEQNAARQFKYGVELYTLKDNTMHRTPDEAKELTEDDQQYITQIVERAVKNDVVFYRAAFLLEQALLAAHAKEPVNWGRLRFAHTDDFAVDIKALMATPPQPIKNTVSFYSPKLVEEVVHVNPFASVAPTAQNFVL